MEKRIDKVETRMGGVEARMGRVESAVTVVSHDVERLDEDVKTGAKDARDDRSKMHGKIDEVLGTLNRTAGAEKVRHGVRQWAMDLLKVGLGLVLGWVLKAVLG